MVSMLSVSDLRFHVPVCIEASGPGSRADEELVRERHLHLRQLQCHPRSNTAPNGKGSSEMTIRKEKKRSRNGGSQRRRSCTVPRSY